MSGTGVSSTTAHTQSSLVRAGRVPLSAPTIFPVIIPAPFEHIAGHVVEPKAIWLHGIHVQRALPKLPARRSMISRESIEIRLVRRDRVAKTERRPRPRATRKLP